MCWIFSGGVNGGCIWEVKGGERTRQREGEMRKRRTDMIIPLLETAVEIVDLAVVFGVIDV